MAKQMDFLPAGRVVPTALHTEMAQSYLEYAMSVIVGRALPDVRDGLKPVHRRILYAMYELGLTPDRPFRKCARVVGDVLGKYHPHGDQAVYEALVRLVQTFSTRYPLLAGHGNFGSVDDDPPAAMRYTETKLAPIAYDTMLGEVGEETVDFVDNFDGSQQEPAILPAKLPMLLLNGCAGIAVGMATNIPPHNLGELVDGLIALIDEPNLSNAALGQYILGPDFPTGGEILDRQGIRDTYETGRGLIPLRGIVHREQVERGKQRKRKAMALVVTEFPYQVNKASWIAKVAQLVQEEKIQGIADLRDESDRQGLRVVLELKRDVDPEAMLAQLYRQTPLQMNFGAILLSLVNQQPRQLSLRDMLLEFLQFRERTLLRLYGHERAQLGERLAIVEGLLIALEHIDPVIAILRNAPDGSSAKQAFTEQLGLTAPQGDALLAMPMRRLTGLEQQKLQDEAEALRQRLGELQRLLSDRPTRLKALKKELRQLKRRFGDERRTRVPAPEPLTGSRLVAPQEREISLTPDPLDDITPATAIGEVEEMQPTAAILEMPLDQLDLIDPTAAIPGDGEGSNDEETEDFEGLEDLAAGEEETAIAPPITKTKLATPTTEPKLTLFNPVVFNAQSQWVQTLRGAIFAQNADAPVTLTQDLPHQVQPWGDRQELWLITPQGKLYPLPLKTLPDGRDTCTFSLAQWLPPKYRNPGAIALLSSPPPAQELFLISRQGRLKRLPLGEVGDLTARGVTLLKMKSGDALTHALAVNPGDEVVLALSSGRLLRYTIGDRLLLPTGKNTQGTPAFRVGPQEQIIAAQVVPPTADLVLVTAQGYGKRLPLAELRPTQVNQIGSWGLKFHPDRDPADTLTVLAVARGDLGLWGGDRWWGLSCGDLPLENKEGTGIALIEAGAAIGGGGTYQHGN